MVYSNQQTKELISTQMTPHEHSNKHLSRLRQLIWLVNTTKNWNRVISIAAFPFLVHMSLNWV